LVGSLGAFGGDDKSLIFRSGGVEATLCKVSPPGGGYRTLQSTGDTSDGPTHADFSPGGRVLASAHSDGVRLWDSLTGKPLTLLPTGTSQSVQFDPTGSNLFVCGSKGLTRWPVAYERSGNTTVLRMGPPQLLAQPKTKPLWASLSPDGG